jgi:molybdenum cofactor cytidylyltransferase
MKFGRIATEAAEGAILAHSLRTPEGAFKKGRTLSAADVAVLAKAGFETVVAARIEADDVAEDEAATRIASAAQGDNTTFAAAFTGRCNLYAETHGIAVIDTRRLAEINALHEAVTIATLPPFEAVEPKQMVATIKIIPFAAPEAAVAAAEALASKSMPLVRVAPFAPKSVGLVMSHLPGTKPSVLDNTVRTVRARLDRLDATLVSDIRINHDETAIGDAVAAEVAAGRDIVLVSGASAVVDRGDVVPIGIEAAGGTIEHFGMPVDPGNLLLLGHITRGGRTVPVIGMPGCARSPKLNGFDWVLRRLAADVPVTRRDVMAMGAGGLLKEISTRPQPRDKETAVKQAPRIAAIVLAAGQSRRMGALNKLLADIDGMPMVRGVVETVRASKADPVLVVTGHQPDEVRAALDGLDVAFVHNPDFADGLSTSLRRGLGALSETVDGALVCLGDMPRVDTTLLDRMIAAFDPLEGRAICLPVTDGKRGNPVLWGAQFFEQIGGVAGDVGARHLIGEYAEAVCEIETEGGAVLTDIDTPEALAAYRAREQA